MDFKTSQGGETTLVFEPEEKEALASIAQRNHISYDEAVKAIAFQRQARPLDGFTELLGYAFPRTSHIQAGLVPPKAKKQPKSDPLVDLENLIRRRISAQQLPTGPTSQSHQAEATLLNALATCLLAQTMRDLDAG
jgi:hypothetical protein